MRLFPLLAAYVGSQASKPRILILILHVLVVIELVRAELTRVRTVCTAALPIASFLLLAALALHLQGGVVLARNHGGRGGDHRLLLVASIVIHCLDLGGQVRQVFIQEVIVVLCASPALRLWPGNSHLCLKIHLHTL